MKKHILRIFGVLLLTVMLTGCGKRQVDLMDFASVDFSGMETRGNVNLNINWDAFYIAVLGEDGAAMDDMQTLMDLVALESSITYAIAQPVEMVNGDIITLSVTSNAEIADKFDVKFVGDNKEFEVVGLLEATEIDLFKDIFLEFSEVAPNARATVRNASADAFIKSVRYTMDQSSNLSNGDEIKVTASYSEYDAESYGYIPMATEKTFVVENTDMYLATYSQIDKDTLAKMATQASDLIESALADKGDAANILYPDEFIYNYNLDALEVQSITPKENIFFQLKPGTSKGYNDVDNSIFMVYQISAKDAISPDGIVVYVPVYYSNIILRDTGAIDVDITKAYVSGANQNYDNMYRDVVTSNKAKYTFEQIEITPAVTPPVAPPVAPLPPTTTTPPPISPPPVSPTA